jgi:hypothetical protein
VLQAVENVFPGKSSGILEPLLGILGAGDLGDGWYYVGSNRGGPARRLIQDMLAVAGGELLATDVREGFARRLRYRESAGHLHQNGWHPSAEAILAFCRTQPELFRVESDRILSVPQLHGPDRLSGVDRVLVEALLSAPGKVRTREDFEREAIGRGVNPNTFNVYTSYSPFLKDLEGGLWTARGVDPDPIEVERLRSSRRKNGRAVMGWSWQPDGKLRILVRLNRTDSLVVGIPGAVRGYLAGREFVVLLSDGSRKGTVRVNEEGTSWGYGPALSRLGAARGDLLAGEFDLVNALVTLSLDISETPTDE